MPAAKPKITVYCAFCGKPKGVSPSRNKKYQRFFCDTNCHGKWQSLNWCGSANGNWKGGSRENTCQYCGDIFYTIPSAKRKYCTPQCSQKARIDARIEVACCVCGKTKRIPKCRYNKHNKFFCDNTCKSIFLSLNQNGDKNIAWAGGATLDPYCAIWSDKEYKNDIRVGRDGNNCLNPTCLKHNNRTVLHHVDYDKQNCTPYNLITLCHSCNTSANKDRNWHTAWYRALLYNRYGYNYIGQGEGNYG